MRKLIGSCEHIAQYDLRKFKGRIFFVTDLHGHYDLLHEELRRAAFNSETDLLFSGGDWTDRGPDSQYVLDYLTEPWIHSVRGNHEQMFIDGFEAHWHPSDRNVRCLKSHGGDWIWNSLDDLQKILIHDVFKDLPIAMELLLPRGRKVGIIHAEVPYNDWNKFKEIEANELEYHGQAVAQWERTWYSRGYKGQVQGVDFVLCGHTPTDTGEVEQHGNMVFADGGSFFRKKVNLIELNDEFMRRIK